MVRLDRHSRGRSDRRSRGFNPTMVRLDRLAPVSKEEFSLVSIPLWFDWIRGLPIGNLTSQLVSIPLWFDWIGTILACDWEKLPVSIPLWFDWILTETFFCSLLTLFQSHYGSIGSRFIQKSFFSIARFNPTMVRLDPRLKLFSHGGRKRFNPTMVRLDLFQLFSGLQQVVWFQSHYGSIGSA